LRLGVLGGTYDPVHFGHLLLAEQAREALSLDQVLLVPAGRPPHKPDRVITPYDLRLGMLELALKGVPGMVASDIERDLERPSYTIETLRGIRSQSPDLEDLWLLLGEDSLAELPTWREPAEIARLARFAVYPRPNGETPGGAVFTSEVNRTWGDRIDRLDGPRLRLSSSEIRERVRGARSIRFLVPEAVRTFILDEGLYRGRSRPDRIG
jgi:nicotinate-nucleotide adenylyltransferase